MPSQSSSVPPRLPLHPTHSQFMVQPSMPHYRPGYGEFGTSVPLLVKQAILLLTAHYYERRLASDNFSETEIPFGVSVLLDSVRWRFYS